MAFRIITLGDSVTWGQGLPEAEKFDQLVLQALLPLHPEGVTLERFAHSGAIIGPGSGRTATNGEVPVSSPTILAQLASVPAPETADLVILNGGINDVGVSRILNPLAVIPSLQNRVEEACHKGMLHLLRVATAAFTKAGCRVLVTGYYTILSDQSDPLQIPDLLGLYGTAVSGFMAEADFFDLLSDRCEEFFQRSEDALRAAVADAADPRIRFVSSGFTAGNAIFVPGTTLLWGLTSGLDPQDPKAAARRAECDLTFDQPADFLRRQQCYRASTGHPNVDGAKQYAAKICAVLGL